MRIDRIKLIAEMARQDIKAQELADKATLSRATIVALRCGKSCNENSVRRVAQALGVATWREMGTRSFISRLKQTRTP